MRNSPIFIGQVLATIIVGTAIGAVIGGAVHLFTLLVG